MNNMLEQLKNKFSSTNIPTPPPFIQHYSGLNKEMKTVEEGLKECGLDFEVAVSPTMFVGSDGNPYTYPNSNVIHRTDTNTPFGVVSNLYTPLSNNDIFGWIEPLMGKSEAVICAGGTMDRGAKVYLSLKFPDQIKIGGIDPIDKYINIIGNHDGTGSTMIMLSPVRYFCQNQLSYSIKEAKQSNNLYRIRHNSKAKEKLELAIQSMNFVNTKYLEISECYNALQKTVINDKQVKEIICRSVFGDAKLQAMIAISGKEDVTDIVFKNQRHVMDAFGISTKENSKLLDIKNYYDTGFGQDIIQGTVWGAYNAITGYYNNVMSFKTTEKRLSNTFGKNQKDLSKVLDMALEYI